MSLYAYDRPVSAPAYVGREQLGRSLLDGVLRGRSFLLCGGPRTGRTSTLEQLIAALVRRWTRQPAEVKLVPVRLDLGRVVSGGPSLMVRELWASLTAAVLEPRVFGNSPPARTPQPTFPKTADPWGVFTEALAGLWDALRGSAGWCQWLLLLEHGDLLLGNKLDSAVKPLAALVAGEGAGRPQAMVVDGGRLFREHLLEPRTPLAAVRPLWLGNLRDAEAEALVRLGFPKAEPARVTELCALTGKHPFVLQRLLAELEARPQAGLAECHQRVLPDLGRLYDEIWAEFDLERGVTYRGAYAAPEHALMQYLIDCGSAVELQQAERDLGIKPLREYAELLEYLGVAEKVLAGNQTVLRAAGQSFNQWYQARVRR